MKAPLQFVIATFLFVTSLHAEPDKLVRRLLGVSSLPVSFTPTKNNQLYQLAVAKFKDGKFVGYCDLPQSITDDRATPAGYVFEAELAWTKHDEKAGFLIDCPSWSSSFIPDVFFDNPLAITRYFAKGKPPEEKLGPFSVLGVAVGVGDRNVLPPTNEQSATEWIKRYPFAVVFLVAPFDDAGQAKDFAKAMPRLSAE